MEERKYHHGRILISRSVPPGGGSCVPQNQTSICCLQPLVWPSQKIEFVSPASLETIRRKPREHMLRRPVGHLQDLAGCVVSILRFLFSPAAVLGRCVPVILQGYELARAAIDGQQIRHHLASHRKSGSVLVALQFFFLIDHRQIRAALGCHLGCFHQHGLQMLVPLLGQGRALRDVCLTLLVPA